MTYTIFILVARKPGTTLAAFTHHYETIHLPLALSILGAAAPVKHTRYYLHHPPTPTPTPSPAASDPLAADVPSIASPSPLTPLTPLTAAASATHDCLSIVEFADEAHFARFNEVVSAGPRREEMERDNAAFVDGGSVVVFAAAGEARVTVPGGLKGL